MRTRLVALALVLLIPVAFAAPANADPITGNIQFGGPGTPTGASTWFGSTGVDFTNPWTVVAASGSYAGLSGPVATFTDINWGAGTGSVSVPVGTIWTITQGGITYTLELATVTFIARGNSFADFIVVNGTGTLTITGGGTNFTPTFGTWSFSASTTSGGTPNLSFSADPNATVVPEPASLALLGTGLAGIAAGLRKRLRKRRES